MNGELVIYGGREGKRKGEKKDRQKNVHRANGCIYSKDIGEWGNRGRGRVILKEEESWVGGIKDLRRKKMLYKGKRLTRESKV